MRCRFRSSGWRRPLAVLAATLACGALSSTAQAAAARQGNKGCVRVEVSGEPDGKRARKFSASAIDDLHFRVVFRKKKIFEPGETMVLNIYLPEGHLFKSLTVPVAAPESPEQEQAVAGHPFPKKVRKAKRDKVSRRPVVTAAAFPVAGTQITRHSLYGRWTVEAWPEGSERSCQARFKLKP